MLKNSTNQYFGHWVPNDVRPQKMNESLQNSVSENKDIENNLKSFVI